MLLQCGLRSDYQTINRIRGIPKLISNKDLYTITEIIKNCQSIDSDNWPEAPIYPKKSYVNRGSLDLLKLLLSYCSRKSGLAEKLIADADELRLILDGQKESSKIYNGWRNEIFGKFVNLLLKGKIAFTIKDDKIEKLEL